jgi:type I restriction enzyme R subunit
MATGTGKTLTAAAVIKLFLRTENASRVLFLVDRLELEDQAATKAFPELLKTDFDTVVYKEHRDDWRHAEVVVTTVQSLLFNNKYQSVFSPTDFDLVISDEAHRSIGGNARAVFEYFIGYKLGLTATPRDYLKGFSGNAADPRDAERRVLLDTYRTFGCENSEPTFRYTLLDGVKDGYLVSPTVIDARTEVTTQLLSEQGFVVSFTDESGEDQEEKYKLREFERRFFSEATNEIFCKTFLDNAMRDPVSAEIGKSIIFAVSQNHAAKLTQSLNVIADKMFPNKYKSDFAVQVTSQVTEAQQFTRDFANNKLKGYGNFLATYRTGKARVCVTVGMMTTGYDCTDILNVGLFRPIFSPTDFIQIKGRGTRKHNFLDQLFDDALRPGIQQPEKATFGLLDFFANCEYFEKEFKYDQVLKVPARKGKNGETGGGGGGGVVVGAYEHLGTDILSTVAEQKIGFEGMRIDREFFRSFEKEVRKNDFLEKAVKDGKWEKVVDYVNSELLDDSGKGFSLDKLRVAAEVDRRLGVREILEKIYGIIPGFKSKDELLEEEFAKFVVDQKPDEAEAIPAIKHFFKAYVTNEKVRRIIEKKDFAELATNPVLSISDFRAVPEKYRTIVPDYIRDYVPVEDFAA